MDEFALIDIIVEAMGDRAQGEWVRLGPGDDAAVIATTPGFDQVASIDVLVPDVHFPAQAPAFLIGYRALMISLSDLAAMGATPRYCIVALTLTEADVGDGSWLAELSRGMAQAARDSGTYICGGNMTRGPLNIAVSAHGEVARGCEVRRSGGRPGDKIYVSGPLGGAGACLRQDMLLPVQVDAMSELQKAYYKPQARFDWQQDLSSASCGIDISDGLLQDLGHLTKASGCGAKLIEENIPLTAGASLADALNASDDYQLLFASAQVHLEAFHIGELCAESGIWLNDKPIDIKGYKHFNA
ncbi:MAG: thiamine-monophosphate kinase [Candidatus Azotimanducaceae bacterium]